MLKNIKMPKIGARTLKTGITVCLCSLISLFVFKRDAAFISCMAGVVCLQNNLKSSVDNGKNRIKGTIVGAIIGFIIMFICQIFGENKLVLSIAAAAGIIATIYTCTMFSIEACINSACVMFLVLIMNVGSAEWLSYSIMRTVDTFVGVLVGVNVNKYMFKDSFKKAKIK